ncbi:MAG: polyprenyl synthetase family protein [Chloroflexota bacterium]|nr:polyprenyl synthetase family protein [Chloroflexota bacterium]
MSRTESSTRQISDPTSVPDQAFAQIDQEIERLVAELAGNAPLLDRMARYHLGFVTANGDPIPEDERFRLRGKRVRPLIAALACQAAGGTIDHAAPLAASIELLHNFTLIHDDIQDRSPNRRHRPTVWNIWGDAQAINAGDALFAAAQIGILNSAAPGIAADHLLAVSRAFNRMTIDIVRGQVLDIEFEGRDDVTPDDYLQMIQGKTSAIVEFAAWAGAVLGGSSVSEARSFADFGMALGIGFQIRDDALGVWGSSEETGKDTADDIRRRKQSLPVLILRALASDDDRACLETIFRKEHIAEDGVETVLCLFEHYGVAHEIEEQVRRYHDDAEAALRRLAATSERAPLDALHRLTDRLALRST